MESIVRHWPRWAGYAAGAWSTGAVAVALYWACGGEAGNPLDGARPAAWAIAACLGAGGIMAVSTVRDVGRHMPRWWPLAGLWGAFAVAGAGTFGFVMNALQLAFTGTVDDWPEFGVEILCAAGAALLAGAALAYQRRTAGACARCGRVHADTGTVRRPAPVSAPPRGVRWAAYAGTLAFVPYVVMKTTWAFGGSFAGIEGERVVAEFERNGASGLVLTLEKYGLDFTTLSAALGIVLLFGLTRGWGQVFPRWTPFAGRGVPRWLPLAPAWLGALTLGPYGVVGTVGYLLPPVVGLGDLPDDPLLHGWSGWTVAACGIVAFAVYGTALGVAAWSYQRRTRPRCVSPGSPAAGAPSGP
ncbi:hypothetical protein SAMN04489713_102544 [Actinomadura madurae]|uniref:Uncharacterized protein n=1 Tax=Actinomadura madurae TaxID=1993 RepID=A0A1I5ACV1_9ACTN|nr:hypothetical protein [Actinomadura madurae]SFN60200.1 hypothetical protein SAMN04489713_102544 [Actinomadura madurae]